MPTPDRMLTTLRQATALVRATPGRRGHVVWPADCNELLVCGDLHGHLGNFQSILKAADLENHPQRHLVFQEVIHGGYRYPDGSDKSHQLVDLIAAMKCRFPRQVHYLPGNHEMAQWTGRKVLKGYDDLNALFRQGPLTRYGKDAGVEIYGAYLELFRALPVMIRTANHVVVCHSLPAAKTLPLFDPARLDRDTVEEADCQPGGSVHSLLWGRDTTDRNAGDFLRKMDADLLVTGHIACDDGFDVPNARQIILDAAESPAGYLLFPTDRPLTHDELVGCVRTV